MKVNVADTITIHDFTIKNIHGGTTLSSELNLVFPTITLIVIREWNDYETGQRGWGLVKDFAYDDIPEDHLNYPEFAEKSMRAKNAVDEIYNRIKGYTHLDAIEHQEILGEMEALHHWIRNTKAFKDNFLVFFSEFNVLTRD